MSPLFRASSKISKSVYFGLLFSALLLAGTTLWSVWYGQATEDLLTGGKKVLVYTPAVAVDYTVSASPLLSVYIDPEGALEIYVDWRTDVGTETHPVRYRFDQGEIYNDSWIPSLSGRSSFCPDTLATGETKYEFFERLLVSKAFTIRVVTSEGRNLTARFDTSGLEAKLEELRHGTAVVWKFKTGGPIFSSPAIDTDGNVIFGSNDTYIYAVSKTGRLLWRTKTGGRVLSSPAISTKDDAVYVGSEDGFLYCLNRRSGTVVWKFKTDAAIVSDPAISADGTLIVFGNNAGVVYAVNTRGQLVWSYKTKGDVRSGPVIGRNGVIYVGSWDGTLYALSFEGKLLGKYSVSEKISATPALDENNNVYVVSRNGLVSCLSSDLRLRWQFRLEAEVVSSPVIGPDRKIYFATMAGDFFALDLSGLLQWTVRLGAPVYGTPVVGADGNIFVPLRNGSVQTLSPSGGVVGGFTVSGPILSSPTMTSDGMLIFGSDDGHLYCVRTQSKGIANSPWPKFRQNLRNTGRAL